MARSFSNVSTGSKVDRLHRMMLDADILREYKQKLAGANDPDDSDMSTDEHDAQDIAMYSDPVACQELNICTRAAPNSPVFFGYETDSGPKEMLFWDICFVKHAVFPPLPDRRYNKPGTLYHSLSLIAPPGEPRVNAVADGIQNLYLRMSTASASRKFANYAPHSWTVDPKHGEQPELFLTNRVLTHASDVKSGRLSTKACSIPQWFDTNGCTQKLVNGTRGAFCFTPDNLFRVCDATVSRNAPRSAQYPSPDVVVSGQLVYVKFSIQASASKPAGFSGGPRSTPWLYSFKPTLRSLIILSKAGPMAMMRQAMIKSPSTNDFEVMQEEPLPEPDQQDLSRELKRLRLA